MVTTAAGPRVAIAMRLIAVVPPCAAPGVVSTLAEIELEALINTTTTTATTATTGRETRAREV
jgi:hypothetical protein